ncbi:hypothetical protein diail_1853 [Diaporthe ilicicola]|nr:hypothetical protein diail_1853 [Diaporthe ilicicola]
MGLKRTAGTPFASPTKAAASAKRSRTQYDYYDEEDDLESPPEDQWSPDTDTGSEMSVDWDDGEQRASSPSDRFVADSTTRFREQARETAEAPHQAQNQNSEACACSASSHRCSASSCGCQGGAACHNPLQKLDLGALFGRDRVTLHPCFVSWVVKEDKHGRMDSERTSTQSLFDLVFGTAYLLEEFDDDVMDAYYEWSWKWDRLPASERDGGRGLELKQELLRWGLTTSREGELVFFSFCHSDGWRESDKDWHCETCGRHIMMTFEMGKHIFSTIDVFVTGGWKWEIHIQSNSQAIN